MGHARDWVGSPDTFILAWGVPIAGLVATMFVGPGLRTIVWTLALIWMGLACLANARRCGRRHCFYTGPFYLVMALAVLLYGTGILPLSTNGWLWLGGAIALGTAGIWGLSEGVWGRFVGRRH